MKQPDKLLILGFGGHARSVADVALACGYRQLIFVDQNARKGESFAGFPVVKSIADNLPADWAGFPASGDGRKRQSQCEEIWSLGLALATLISPAATTGPDCTVCEGSFVGHHAHVGPATRIGVGCIVNTAAVVEHECTVGDYSHISVNSTMAGRSSLGRLCMLGAGAILIDGISVGDEVTIGAGGVVHRSISLPGTYVGVPAVRLP
ncbi:acetyltransferase [Pseudomonas schmalbachii]|uniref:Acetyltransferase n=1 Tax=Pseudomonas schmalbachii TaxID=2816993 RepID=A0ABS3TUH3_9PSED|nr:acetyltransferase [Pseudomonas schmalbachii]MBO3276224.1 acetyltransferase [Pseudomonas schmalbachii]